MSSANTPFADLVSTLTLPELPNVVPKVLLVDDQDSRLLTYEALLQDMPLETVRARSAQEALQQLLRLEFAVILLDVQMPQMDGFELAHLIRDHPRLERTPIIFVTGVNMSDMDQLKGYEAGAIDYIAVPIVPAILRSKVSLLIELHQRRKQLEMFNAALFESREGLAAKHARAVADNEAQLRAVFEHPTDLAVILKATRDAAGRVSDWTYTNANKNSLKLMRMTAEQLIGQTLKEMLPERFEETSERCKRVLESRVPMHYESRYQDRCFFITLYAIGVDLVVSSGVDVTEQKRAQDALEAADRRKDEFLAMLAHELRNPIAPIRNAAAILARTVPATDDSQSSISIIQRQTTHLARLLDDLLDVARITQGRIELKRETFEVLASVRSVIDSMKTIAGDKGQVLTLSHAIPRAFIHGDRVRIEQCLINLLGNAIKFTPTNGVINVDISVENSEVVLSIADNGMGISAEFIPNVFELFAQSERPLDRSLGGLGIGLAICKRLIEMHGGNISVHSQGEGKGSTFLFRLPTASEPNVIAEKPTRIDGSRRILIVDDNQDNAISLALLLGLCGHITKAALSGEEALDLLNAFNPDLILLDLGLPGMDGYEVARRVKDRAHTVQIVAMSGYGQAHDREKTAATGFSGHLVKPFDVDDLADWLNSDRRTAVSLHSTALS